MILRAKGPPGPTVGAGLAKGLLDVAVARGAPRDLLLARCGIASDDLANQDGRVPLASYMALMRVGKELSGDPALALHFGEALNLSDISIFGNIGSATPTIQEGMKQLNHYGRLLIEVGGMNSAERFSLVREGKQTWLVDNRPDPDGFPELTESGFARIVCWTRALSDPGREFVKAVQVTHDKPVYSAEYERILRVPVSFGCDRNALSIDEAWTPKGFVPPSRYVTEVLRERAEQLLQSLEGAATVRGRVESAIAPLLHTGRVGADAVAKALGLSRKTLYRKLKEEETSFAAVLDDVRRRSALHHLNGRGASVNETAYLVGFSDASAFSRAFKRWTSVSPRDWKRRTQ